MRVGFRGGNRGYRLVEMGKVFGDKLSEVILLICQLLRLVKCYA